MIQPGPRSSSVVGWQATAPPRSNPASRCRLLYVEDDKALRQMLSWELSDLGYDVVPVGTCAEARATIEANRFDLGLIDLGLPDGDGASLACTLIGEQPNLNIVLYTGNPAPLAAKRRPACVRALLSKPVTVDEVDAALRGSAAARRTTSVAVVC